MKKLFSVLVILCWLTLPAFSQGQQQQPGPGPGVLETMKIGYITQRLNLTPQEAEKFWPIYRQYSAEKRQAYAQYRNDNNEIGLEENLLNIKKKYSVEFVKAIPPPKINSFWRVEIDFNEFVRKEWQRRQQQQKRFPPPGR
ncbi:hypothetical protein [Puia dinghuensis]|uniref:Uncharacterized protein n=1 Tax=Puia dinghuensis TaxID=1792502 RepID=A0A8J2XUI3_9BACT|nr:hypothetical protein [Puia dinghuensis]GGB07659.1 hypothetical protein GCM10011511_33970 [Puia dinghuensis]